MLTIYHDPGCIFSHACLVILRHRKGDYTKVNYKKEPFTAEVLSEIIKKLGVKPIDLIQKKHREWKNLYAYLDFSDDELIALMLDNHDLIIRPIIVSGDTAVIGRPPKNLINLLKGRRKISKSKHQIPLSDYFR